MATTGVVVLVAMVVVAALAAIAADNAARARAWQRIADERRWNRAQPTLRRTTTYFGPPDDPGAHPSGRAEDIRSRSRTEGEG